MFFTIIFTNLRGISAFASWAKKWLYCGDIVWKKNLVIPIMCFVYFNFSCACGWNWILCKKAWSHTLSKTTTYMSVDRRLRDSSYITTTTTMTLQSLNRNLWAHCNSLRTPKLRIVSETLSHSEAKLIHFRFYAACCSSVSKGLKWSIKTWI